MILNLRFASYILLDLTFDNHKLLLSTVYRPPNVNKTVWNIFKCCLDIAFGISNNIIIFGNLNVELLTDVRRHPLNDIMLQYGYNNIIRKSTRISNT